MPKSKPPRRPTTISRDSAVLGRGLPTTISPEKWVEAWIATIHGLLHADGIRAMTAVMEREPILAIKVTGIVSEVCEHVAETPRLAAFRDVMRALCGPQILPMVDAERWIPANITDLAAAMFGPDVEAEAV